MQHQFTYDQLLALLITYQPIRLNWNGFQQRTVTTKRLAHPITEEMLGPHQHFRSSFGPAVGKRGCAFS